MDINKLKKLLNISNQDIADMFDMSYNAYANSSAKQRYETALCRLLECALLGGKKNETKNLTDTDHRIKNETEPLILYGVSQQRELLNAFQEYYQKGDYDDEYSFDENINRFLKAFNCG